MCVLALAWEAHPRWRLVVAGNRDELHARPAAPLRRWEGAHPILAGQDLESGGTWMGVSEQGRLAVVTNLRGFGPPEPGRPSRGLLLRDLLAGAGRYADPSDADLFELNPFNLMVVDQGGLSFWHNRPGAERRALPSGLYGLSNGALDAPWPKTLRLKAGLLAWLGAEAARPEALLDKLRDDTLPPSGLPAAAPSDVAQEPAQSPIFIRHPVYGTRASTVAAVDHQGRGLIVERRFGADAEPAGETALAFSWSNTRQG